MHAHMVLNTLFIIYIVGAFVVILIAWIIRLEIKMRKLLRGKNATSLEDTIAQAHTRLDLLTEFRKDALAYFSDVEQRLLRSIQTVETIRFNPFKGSGEGGNQSFSTAFINEKGEGVVLSSLYSRDRVSIFSKPVLKFESEFGLTDEEKGVIYEARNKLGVKK